MKVWNEMSITESLMCLLSLISFSRWKIWSNLCRYFGTRLVLNLTKQFKSWKFYYYYFFNYFCDAVYRFEGEPYVYDHTGPQAALLQDHSLQCPDDSAALDESMWVQNKMNTDTVNLYMILYANERFLPNFPFYKCIGSYFSKSCLFFWSVLNTNSTLP